MALEARSPVKSEGKSIGVEMDVAPGTSTMAATFAFVSNIVAGGVLGFPFCFARCGLLLGLLLLAAVASTQLLTLKQLVWASAVSGAHSYDELVDLCFGRRGSQLCTACVVLLQFGCLVAYLAILADVLSDATNALVPPGAEPSRPQFIAGTVGLILLPLSCGVRSASGLALASALSTALVAVFAGVVLVYALKPDAGARASPLSLWQPEGLTLALPMMVFALTGHSGLFPIVATMKDRRTRTVLGMLGGSMRASCALYCLLGTAGYAAFRDRTAGNLLRNLAGGVPGARTLSMRCLRLGFAASIAGSVPVTLVPIRDVLMGWAFPAAAAAYGAAHPLYHCLLTGAILAAVLATALLVPNLEFVLALTGATSSIALAYLFPAALFIRITAPRERAPPPAASAASMEEGSAAAAGGEVRREKEVEVFGPWLAGWPNRCLAWAALGFGLAAMLGCTRATLSAVSQEARVVGLAQSLVVKADVAATAAAALGRAAQAACTLGSAGAATAALAGGAAANVSTAPGAVSSAQAMGSQQCRTATAASAAASAGPAGNAHVSPPPPLSGRPGIAGAGEAAHTALGVAADSALAAAGAAADAAMTAVSAEVAGAAPEDVSRAKEIAEAIGGDRVDATLDLVVNVEAALATSYGANASSFGGASLQVTPQPPPPLGGGTIPAVQAAATVGTATAVALRNVTGTGFAGGLGSKNVTEQIGHLAMSAKVGAAVAEAVTAVGGIVAGNTSAAPGSQALSAALPLGGALLEALRERELEKPRGDAAGAGMLALPGKQQPGKNGSAGAELGDAQELLTELGELEAAVGADAAEREAERAADLDAALLAQAIKRTKQGVSSSVGVAGKSSSRPDAGKSGARQDADEVVIASRRS